MHVRGNISKVILSIVSMQSTATQSRGLNRSHMAMPNVNRRKHKCCAEPDLQRSRVQQTGEGLARSCLWPQCLPPRAPGSVLRSSVPALYKEAPSTSRRKCASAGPCQVHDWPLTHRTVITRTLFGGLGLLSVLKLSPCSFVP